MVDPFRQTGAGTGQFLAECLNHVMETAAAVVVRQERPTPWALRPIGPAPRVPLPTAASIEDAEFVLAVALAAYRDGVPLLIEDLVAMFEEHPMALFYESPWHMASTWMRWLLDLAPALWLDYLRLVPGWGAAIGELVPAWAEKNEEAPSGC